jgi:hypothetical protein
MRQYVVSLIQGCYQSAPAVARLYAQSPILKHKERQRLSSRAAMEESRTMVPETQTGNTASVCANAAERAST